MIIEALGRCERLEATTTTDQHLHCMLSCEQTAQCIRTAVPHDVATDLQQIYHIHEVFAY